MMPQKRRDTAGEITTRRQTAPILCIMVELVGVEVLFSSSLAPRYEQIFSQRFCSDEFASSIGVPILLAKSLQGEKSGSYLGFWLRWTGPEPFFYPNWRYDASRFSRTGSAPSNSPAVSEFLCDRSRVWIAIAPPPTGLRPSFGAYCGCNLITLKLRTST